MAKIYGKKYSAKIKRDLYAEVTNSIIAKLEAGNAAPWTKNWNGGGGMPKRSTGEYYKGINSVVLMMSDHAGQYWFTYKQAKDAGGQVREGQKGTTIIFYKQIKTTDKDTGKDKFFPMMKSYVVFNQDQIDNLPEKYAVSNDTISNNNERLQSVDDYIANTGAIINHGGTKAYYTPSNDSVQLPTFESFTSAAAYYGTALHELGHWTGHMSRLDRFDDKGNVGTMSKPDIAREELIAELCATFLTASLGIEKTIDENHVSYLQSWLTLLRSDKKAIFTAAAAAQRACDLLDLLAFDIVDVAEEAAQDTYETKGGVIVSRPLSKDNQMSLERYTDIAKMKTSDALTYAISDIRAAWAANPNFQDIAGPNGPYATKLWDEFDAYTVELQRRTKGKKVCPTCGK